MKTMLRLSLELVVISFVIIFLNNSFSQEKHAEISLGVKADAAANLIGVARPEWMAKDLPQIAAYKFFEALSESGYVSKNNLLPSMGFNQEDKRLTPITLSLKHPIGREPISGAEMALVLTAYRDSAAVSYNDLEERVRKLENKLAQIEKECCPEK